MPTTTRAMAWTWSRSCRQRVHSVLLQLLAIASRARAWMLNSPPDSLATWDHRDNLAVPREAWYRTASHCDDALYDGSSGLWVL
ncbi:hypothetical protein BD414DRAFT_60228 [Trametes punicea]|nr:hypothetical protein BD414DRAFT_60228 [Trametes punicea]